LQRPTETPVVVEVPEQLADYEVDTARAADFDTLLSGGIS
jgi:hypothetical protein